MNQNKVISKQLQELVSKAVMILGQAITKEYGQKTFNKIESLRKEMKTLRSASPDLVEEKLSKHLKKMRNYSKNEIHQICNSFSLMLELTNRCETAYRAYKLERHEVQIPKKKPYGIIFVLTAHPTEARSPELLGLFENIQKILVEWLKSPYQDYSEELFHLLIISLKVSLARKSSPSVKDEAQNIYSYILEDSIIEKLIFFSSKGVNVSLRSWVGGDKDGHPGVNENSFLESLSQSRLKIAIFIEKKLINSQKYLGYMDDDKLIKLISKLEYNLHLIEGLKKLKNNDGLKIKEFKKSFKELLSLYEKTIKAKSIDLEAISQVLWIFPALVVALEFREDSAVVKEAIDSEDDFAITKMLKKLKGVSNGFESKWYVRGFVLSMVEDAKDISNGLRLLKKVLGKYLIPVVPLFENEKALVNATEILTNYLDKNKSVINTHQSKWGARFEVMVGYSDSSKENGVLPSRVMVSESLKKIENVLKKHELTPVFFHGSGGSIERGGGSLKEQTAWWPKSAINTYKATIQGEMVARNFGSSEVMSKQVQVILNQLGKYKLNKKKDTKTFKLFAEKVRLSYSKKIEDKDFLSIIEHATPYSFLHHLKIGSRPSKRPGGSIKNNLRAIPWILCWTQTRTLFPTWWGVGQAWRELNEKERKELKRDYSNNPVFTSYVKALGFTLAKIELGVWKLYLENAAIDNEQKKKMYSEFKKELKNTHEFFRYITGEKEFLWFRPWLQQSIDLRSSMIHPLNLCQLESLRRNDLELLRNSVTGIACGMLTTG